MRVCSRAAKFLRYDETSRCVVRGSGASESNDDKSENNSHDSVRGSVNAQCEQWHCVVRISLAGTTFSKSYAKSYVIKKVSRGVLREIPSLTAFMRVKIQNLWLYCKKGIIVWKHLELKIGAELLGAVFFRRSSCCETISTSNLFKLSKL